MKEKLKPIKKYKKPLYPTLAKFVEKPQSIQSNIPLKWAANSLLTGALLAFTLNTTVGQQVNKDKINKIQVAPLFIHGEGRGSRGGMIDIGVFMSEQEAKQIITEEFNKAGINLTETLPGDTVMLQIIHGKYVFVEEKDTINNVIWEKLINKSDTIYKVKKLNGRLSKLNFVFEFVPARPVIEEHVSTVTNYISKEPAEKLRQAILKEGKLNAAVFYEPIWPSRCPACELQKQVRDFIVWLKDNGYLK